MDKEKQLRKKLTSGEVNRILVAVDSDVIRASRTVHEFWQEDFSQYMRMAIWNEIKNRDFDSYEGAIRFVKGNITLFKMKAMDKIKKEIESRDRVFKVASIYYQRLGNKNHDYSLDINAILEQIPEKDKEIALFIIENCGENLCTEEARNKFGYATRYGFYKRAQVVMRAIRDICIKNNIGLYLEMRGGE